MEEEVLEGVAVPNQEEGASILPAVEAFLVEEEASCPGVEGLHHDHAALEDNLQEASEVLHLPWMEAVEEALDEILEVPAAWEAFLQGEELVEEASRGSLDVLHA